jgi:hypothetical protein
VSVRNFCLTVASAAAVLALSTAAHAQARTDFSGFWELRGELPRPGPAPTTPQAKKNYTALRAARAAKTGAVAPEARWCRFFGMPFIMSSSPPIDLVQNDRELVVLSEWPTAARHIYLNRKEFPKEEEFDQTSNGFSIGRFEGADLIVETRYFTPERGIPLIPGGGYKTTNTRLLERYRLLSGGEQMEVTFTWTDPEVFEKPWTYSFTYHRSAPDTYALEGYCDAEDPMTATTIEEPEQK